MSEPSQAVVTDPTAASLEEIDRLLTIPTVFSNKIYVVNTPAGMVLTFAEVRAEPGPMAPRASILLPYQAVEKLGELIQHAMKNVQVVEVPPS